MSIAVCELVRQTIVFNRVFSSIFIRISDMAKEYDLNVINMLNRFCIANYMHDSTMIYWNLLY